ncbi:MAG: hypothetical protein IH957_03245 [Chloroflexi bacterium]|nr:hypothetical protein [Chloroflexota bacterium]
MLVKDSKQSESKLLELVEDTTSQLAKDFDGRLEPGIIRQVVTEVFESLRGSTVPDFVPLFVYRSARERLTALERSAAQA